MPPSINDIATRTGALQTNRIKVNVNVKEVTAACSLPTYLPRPATQWTATQDSLLDVLETDNQALITSAGGGSPSENGISCTKEND